MTADYIKLAANMIQASIHHSNSIKRLASQSRNAISLISSEYRNQLVRRGNSAHQIPFERRHYSALISCYNRSNFSPLLEQPVEKKYIVSSRFYSTKDKTNQNDESGHDQKKSPIGSKFQKDSTIKHSELESLNGVISKHQASENVESTNKDSLEDLEYLGMDKNDDDIIDLSQNGEVINKKSGNIEPGNRNHIDDSTNSQNSTYDYEDAYDLEDDLEDIPIDADYIASEDGVAKLEDDDVFKSHYFDTYQIYTQLKSANFTDAQSDVIMRAVRDLLSDRLLHCSEENIDKSGADNEAYLFEAACSELRTEVQKFREMQTAEYTSNLARLQREVEILQQELNESMTTLKSETDLDINDRKNQTIEEESLVNLEIQELNNRIAVEIISDLKSEIESLRWQTTRRGLSAVVFVAFSVLVGISFTAKKDAQLKALKAAEAAEEAKKYEARRSSISYSVPMLEDRAEDVSFDETISIPMLENIVRDDQLHKSKMQSISK